MTTITKSLFLAAGLCFLTSSLASAQTLAGTVRDTSGAVLPGVTVEASSPALIEKSRTAVSDGNGQYQITNLPPGAYSITFSLPGFATVVRDGVELTGGGVTTINAELRVGAVDRERDGDGRDAGRGRAVGPAADGARAATSCGRCPRRAATATTWPPCPRFRPRASTTASGRTRTSSPPAAAAPTRRRPDRRPERRVALQRRRRVELRLRHEQRDRSPGVDLRRPGRSRPGAPSFNIIPKTGGNNFSGNAFGSWAGQWGQSSNIDDELRALGFADAPALVKNWDGNFSLGGPIKRDRLWFFANTRTTGNFQETQNQYANKNVGNASAWTWARDENVRVRNDTSRFVNSIRLTSQVTQRNKVGFYYDYTDELQRVVGQQGQRGVPQPGRRLDGLRARHRSRRGHHVAGVGHDLERPVEHHAGHVDVAHLEPRAVRERLLGFPRPVGRRDAGRRDHRPDPRHRAVHQRRRAVRQLSVPRMARAAVAEPEARHLALVARRTSRAATT